MWAKRFETGESTLNLMYLRRSLRYAKGKLFPSTAPIPLVQRSQKAESHDVNWISDLHRGDPVGKNVNLSTQTASNLFAVFFGLLTVVAHRYLTILFGYVFARRGMFSQAVAKGTSSITMNLALPALIFSSIVPAFTPAIIPAIGPLALLAVVYILIGLLCGLAIREVCYVPRNFWQGIVVASGLSNWSSLRMSWFALKVTWYDPPLMLIPLATAVLMSITQSSPFDPETDTNRESV